MLRQIFVIFLAFSHLYQTRASIYGFSFGSSCSQVPVISDFDISRYLGTWYEIERIPMFFERGLNCVTANYDLLSDSKISVKNSGIMKNGKSTSVIGEAHAPNADEEPNKLYVDFRNIGKHSDRKNAANYHVWLTDYDNYSLVYSCDIILGFIKFEAAWILSRSKELDEAKIEHLKRLLNSSGVDQTKLERVSQNC
ncbi:apolipo D [Brachionus plicatilis]|uniref:Apolipoprotein D n=1 Tax=Brachionus plicatilis TaxID=10195 RepID=A0A3M7P300_BRAPC|nr:apolipo D [Brachionus plicatilis]